MHRSNLRLKENEHNCRVATAQAPLKDRQYQRLPLAAGCKPTELADLSARPAIEASGDKDCTMVVREQHAALLQQAKEPYQG